jgi:hypothetical protein
LLRLPFGVKEKVYFPFFIGYLSVVIAAVPEKPLKNANEK